METVPQYREKRGKGLALLSLLQGTQKVRPRRKGKSWARHSERQKTEETKRPRDSDTRSQKQTHELGSEAGKDPESQRNCKAGL